MSSLPRTPGSPAGFGGWVHRLHPNRWSGSAPLLGGTVGGQTMVGCVGPVGSGELDLLIKAHLYQELERLTIATVRLREPSHRCGCYHDNALDIKVTYFSTKYEMGLMVLAGSLVISELNSQRAFKEIDFTLKLNFLSTSAHCFINLLTSTQTPRVFKNMYHIFF